MTPHATGRVEEARFCREIPASCCSLPCSSREWQRCGRRKMSSWSVCECYELRHTLANAWLAPCCPEIQQGPLPTDGMDGRRLLIQGQQTRCQIGRSVSVVLGNRGRLNVKRWYGHFLCSDTEGADGNFGDHRRLVPQGYQAMVQCGMS